MPKKIIHAYKLLSVFFWLTVLGGITLALRMVSFGLLTNFNRSVLVPACCKYILFTIGIRVDDRVKLRLENGPYFITFNHNSILDAFVLMSLGLKNTRFLVTERSLWTLAVGNFMSWSIGTLYIPTKKNRTRRVAFFKRTERRVVREQVNIVGSSEGVHNHIHGIADFNRGVYHMALNARMPVVALFIFVPKDSNPFNDYSFFKPGVIRFEVLDIFDTSEWNLDTLDDEIEKIRTRYIQKFEETETELAYEID